MKSMIKELYYRNRGNMDCVPLSGEYWELFHKAVDIYELIEKNLSDEMKSLFENFCEMKDKAEAEIMECYYTEGMKVGLLLGVEACN